MPRLNAGLGIGLCAAAALAGFALGRLAPRPAAEVPALAEEVRAALREGDLLTRSQRISNLLEHLDPNNLLEVAAVYDQLLPGISAWEVRPFVAAWARFDPASAFEHVLAWPPGVQRQAGAETALETWALRDPAMARLAFDEALAANPGVEQRLVKGIVAGWAESGQEGLEGFIAELQDDPREFASGVVLSMYMRRGGADAAIDWADSILARGAYGDEFRLSVFFATIRVVTRTDPERVAAWALGQAGNDYAKDVLRLVATQWASVDGKAALGWLREREAGVDRDRAARVAFLGWVPRDREGAEAWLAQETPSAYLDSALRAYAKTQENAAPQQAVGWCERIADAERQRRCLSSAASGWYRRDGAAAEAWLQESPLDEQARAEVRSGERRPRRQRGER